MSTSTIDSAAVGVSFIDQQLIVHLRDGRTISAPLSWFPRLADADDEARAQWRLIGEGVGIHWPTVDEDLSISALLRRV